jgi:hypothetical protein
MPRGWPPRLKFQARREAMVEKAARFSGGFG